VRNLQSGIGSRLANVLLYLAGFGTLFYGLVIFRAALVTYRRKADGHTFSMAAEVAREGILYGLAIAVAGGLIISIGINLHRLKQRQKLLASRQRDFEAFKDSKARINLERHEPPGSRKPLIVLIAMVVLVGLYVTHQQFAPANPNPDRPYLGNTQPTPLHEVDAGSWKFDQFSD